MKKLLLTLLISTSLIGTSQALTFVNNNSNSDAEIQTAKKPIDQNSILASEQTPFKLRGMNFSAFESDYWENPHEVEATLDFLVELGANVVVLDWLVEFEDDGHISGNGLGVQPPWEEIEFVMLSAKEKGLKTILKPHLGSVNLPGQNRHEGNTTTKKFRPENFFPDWNSYLIRMIESLPTGDVYAISIGTESNFIDWKEKKRWSNLVTSIRKVYSGLLTYDAMFSQYKGGHHDLSDVVIWDLLDFISCSFYVRLTENKKPSVEELMVLMRSNKNVDRYDAIGYIKGISEKYDKPFFVIEGGYQSAEEGLWHTNKDFRYKDAISQDLQKIGLDAYLRVLNSSQGDWLMGVSLWDLQPRHLRYATQSDHHYKVGWGIYGKSATGTVKKWFSLNEDGNPKTKMTTWYENGQIKNEVN